MLLDPIIVRALRVVSALAPRHKVPARLADDVADRLYRDELPASSGLDVGLWGGHVFKAAAKTATRLHGIAVNGEDAASPERG